MLQREESKPASPCAKCGAGSECQAWGNRLCYRCMAQWFEAAATWPRDTRDWPARTKAWIAPKLARAA